MERLLNFKGLLALIALLLALNLTVAWLRPASPPAGAPGGWFVAPARAETTVTSGGYTTHIYTTNPEGNVLYVWVWDGSGYKPDRYVFVEK